jgi:hypothetical protein
MTPRIILGRLAQALNTICTDQQMADLLNATLSADGDDRLSDLEANLVMRFHCELADRNPKAVSIASGIEWLS